MRNLFIRALGEQARTDRRILLLTAECGYSVTEGFAGEFPDRYYNLGIAEQSLVGTAAGAALRGLKPVAYTMAMFLAMRAYEQIRVDLCYQNLPVILAGVGPGLSYGAAGTTHHATEDAAILRALPNLTIVYPSCEADVRGALTTALTLPGPSYIGLARASREFSVSYGPGEFRLGKALPLTEGNDAALFSHGAMLPTALAAAATLGREGLALRVYNLHTLKPLDREEILAAARDCGAVFTLEEENIIGGLGSAAAECLAEASSGAIFRRLGIPDRYPDAAGSQAWLLRQYGIDAEGVADSIREVLRHGG
jgi:transketolase